MTGLVNGSNQMKCVSLTNQKCTTQRTIINLNHNECTQGLHYYPVLVNLDRCARSYKTLNEFSNKVCVPNKTKDLNLK